jgi:hypothetical protein
VGAASASRPGSDRCFERVGINGIHAEWNYIPVRQRRVQSRPAGDDRAIWRGGPGCLLLIVQRSLTCGNPLTNMNLER